MANVEVEAFAAGGADYVTKPLRPREVLARLATHLRSARVELAFVLGDPAYYGRFGFEAATARGFDSPYAGEYFLGIRLNDGPCVHTPGAASHARAFAALGEDA